jgi:hypothetical protein
MSSGKSDICASKKMHLWVIDWIVFNLSKLGLCNIKDSLQQLFCAIVLKYHLITWPAWKSFKGEFSMTLKIFMIL